MSTTYERIEPSEVKQTEKQENSFTVSPHYLKNRTVATSLLVTCTDPKNTLENIKKMHTENPSSLFACDNSEEGDTPLAVTLERMLISDDYQEIAFFLISLQTPLSLDVRLGCNAVELIAYYGLDKVLDKILEISPFMLYSDRYYPNLSVDKLTSFNETHFYRLFELAQADVPKTKVYGNVITKERLEEIREKKKSMAQKLYGESKLYCCYLLKTVNKIKIKEIFPQKILTIRIPLKNYSQPCLMN